MATSPAARTSPKHAMATSPDARLTLGRSRGARVCSWCDHVHHMHEYMVAVYSWWRTEELLSSTPHVKPQHGPPPSPQHGPLTWGAGAARGAARAAAAAARGPHRRRPGPARCRARPAAQPARPAAQPARPAAQPARLVGADLRVGRGGPGPGPRRRASGREGGRGGSGRPGGAEAARGREGPTGPRRPGAPKPRAPRPATRVAGAPNSRLGGRAPNSRPGDVLRIVDQGTCSE